MPVNKVSQRLNAMPDAAARESLLKCCASAAWCDAMLALRPYDGDAELAASASEVWWSLDRAAWLEAFAAHPMIGDINTLRAKYANTAAWAANEQSSVALAEDKVLDELASYNRRYHERFGYIFIICATGKSAAEMLALLKARYENDCQAELLIAAAEQLKITLLRLEKLSP
jgi:2-oxo-4-hydroxy-4-carboxy-5-ureidoimidazoline decarboxylase